MAYGLAPEVSLPAKVLVDGVAVFGPDDAIVGFDAQYGDDLGRVFWQLRPSKPILAPSINQNSQTTAYGNKALDDGTN